MTLPCFQYASTLSEILLSPMVFIYDEHDPCFLRYASAGKQIKKECIERLLSKSDLSYEAAEYQVEVRLFTLIQLTRISILPTMYHIWPKQYTTFYDEYKELHGRLLHNRRCPETRRISTRFRDLSRHFSLSKLSTDQKDAFEQLVQRISLLLENPEGEEEIENSKTKVVSS